MSQKMREALSIPNLLTYFRLLLIPVFVSVYVSGHYVWAIVCLAASALSDVADGLIARRFNMVTSLGKLIDPMADKLTQGAVFFCVAWNRPAVWLVFGLLVVKELTQLAVGISVLRRTGAQSSKWYGKLCTVVLYASMAVFVLFPDIPRWAVIGIVSLCGAVLLLSLVMYICYFTRLVRESRAAGEATDHESAE